MRAGALGPLSRVLGPLILGISSILWPKLALWAALLTFLAWASRPALADRARRLTNVGLALASAAALVGLVRFTLVEAIPGVLEAGRRAVGKRAVSRLREIVFAEDVMRRTARIDPDGDGIGSAALLGELAGVVPLRGGAPLSIPPLDKTYQRVLPTPIGPAVSAAGYLFIVCVPAAGGGFTARPGAAVDDEAAERRFVAYAWPDAAATDLGESYFIDEHERILVTSSTAYRGTSRVPACDAALTPGAARDWRVWERKPPRESLPGDAPSTPRR